MNSRAVGLVRKVLSARVLAGVASVTESGPVPQPALWNLRSAPLYLSNKPGLRSSLLPASRTSCVRLVLDHQRA